MLSHKLLWPDQAPPDINVTLTLIYAPFQRELFLVKKDLFFI